MTDLCTAFLVEAARTFRIGLAQNGDLDPQTSNLSVGVLRAQGAVWLDIFAGNSPGFFRGPTTWGTKERRTFSQRGPFTLRSVRFPLNQVLQCPFSHFLTPFLIGRFGSPNLGKRENKIECQLSLSSQIWTWNPRVPLKENRLLPRRFEHTAHVRTPHRGRGGVTSDAGAAGL